MVTLRDFMNPARGVDQPSMLLDEHKGRCLCGKTVALYDNAVKPHRAKVNGDKSRKARKGEWCPIPALIEKAVKSGNASGIVMD